MKKVLLIPLILSSVLASIAQGIRADSPGFAFDNFNYPIEFRDENGLDKNLGIFLSKDTLNTTQSYFKQVNFVYSKFTDGILKSSKTRSGNGVVSYSVSQPYGRLNFTPQVNVNFGEGKTINLTGSSSSLIIGLKMDLSSLATTNSGVKIKFAIKDANGILIDSKGSNGGTSSQWKDEIFIQIDKKGSYNVSPDLGNNIIEIDTINGNTYVNIDFRSYNNQIGYEAVYPKLTEFEYLINENCEGNIRGDNGVLGASKPKLGFDVTKVAGFQITFTQKSQNPADCYYNQELTDFKFDFTGFILGNTHISTSYLDAGPLEIKNEFESSSNKLVAYPNPVKDGYLNLSQNVENVKVYDAIGNMVFSTNSTSKINVDGFAKGLYVLKSSNGSTRFVVE